MTRPFLLSRNRIFTHSIVALLSLGIAGVTVSSSGCGAPVGKQAAPSATHEILGRIDSQPQTRAETGIAGWTATREGAVVLFDGKTAEGVSVRQMMLQPFSTTVNQNGRSVVVNGFEISTSGGGLIRIASDRRVLEARADDGTFAAFARDTAGLRSGDETLDCSLLDEWLCANLVIGVLVGCDFNPLCAAIFLALSPCLDCLCEFTFCDSGGGGGGSGSGGNTCTDCGDGTVACYPMQCP